MTNKVTLEEVETLKNDITELLNQIVVKLNKIENRPTSLWKSDGESQIPGAAAEDFLYCLKNYVQLVLEDENQASNFEDQYYTSQC